MLRTIMRVSASGADKFQRAPTLGGECYREYGLRLRRACLSFQRAPTLGGECYEYENLRLVNVYGFQQAPTLGGECYPRNK